MGTRSAVGVADGDGWRARHVHYDGYPTGVGLAVYQIVERDGLERAVEKLTVENRSWSTLTAELEPGRKLMDWPERAWVAGYGEADNSIDYWEAEDATEAEWVYLATPEGLVILESAGDDTFHPPVTIPWGLPDKWALSILGGIYERSWSKAAAGAFA